MTPADVAKLVARLATVGFVCAVAIGTDLPRGGDVDHPVTLDRMVDEARAAGGATALPPLAQRKAASEPGQPTTPRLQ